MTETKCNCACGHPNEEPCFYCLNNHTYLKQKSRRLEILDWLHENAKEAEDRSLIYIGNEGTVPEDDYGVLIDLLEKYAAFRLGAAAPSLPSCKARAQGTPGGMDPVDCDWPFCGCDPKADKVIEAIEESGFKIVQAHQWYDTICGACQLMDAWKSSDPQIWSEWDQQIRDRLSKILAALSSDNVSKEQG